MNGEEPPLPRMAPQVLWPPRWWHRLARGRAGLQGDFSWGIRFGKAKSKTRSQTAERTSQTPRAVPGPEVRGSGGGGWLCLQKSPPRDTPQ